MRILHSFLIFSMISLALSAVSGGRTPEPVGQWTPIKDPNDPHVVEIAKFAVDEYDKRHEANLTLEEVKRGRTQAVAGTNYWLVLAAKEKSTTATKDYVAVVLEKPWQHFKNLTSFKPFLK